MDSECVNCDDLARENDQLRARLTEVEAFAAAEHAAWQTVNDRRAIAEARIAEAEREQLRNDLREALAYADQYRAAAAGDDQTTHAETHSEDTMFKVRDALRCAGLREIDIVDAVMEMQNAGILFRERAAAAGDDRATTTYRLDGTPNLRHISHPAGDGAAGDDRVGDQ